jgi:hypothetical protein
VIVGEVFVERTEKTEFPGSGFSRQGSLASQKTAPEKNLHFGGSKVGGL